MHLMTKVPRIGIDCRFAHTNSGLGRYTHELVTHLLMRNDPIEYVLFVRSMDDSWSREVMHLHTERCSLITASFPHYSLSEQLFFPRVIKKASLDLFFSPHFNVPFLCPVPFVVTIHDLILHRYPNQALFFKRWIYRCVIGHAIKRARRIIAVSAFTQNEVRTFYGEKVAAKTTVVHEGVDAAFSARSSLEQEKVCSKYAIHKPFFLYIGNAKEHKNVQMLIDAFLDARIGNSLILVTGGKEVDTLHIPSDASIHVVTNVRDEDLPALYCAAQCFVTASLYEGFCLPAVEAIACGCPVIAFNTGAIPDIIGKHAVLVEPQFHALVHALRTPPPRVSACRLYDWDRTAEATVKVLQSAF